MSQKKSKKKGREGGRESSLTSLSIPIWFYFNLTLVTYEILLSCLHFLSQSWLMAFKVKIIGLHQACFITLVHKECERLENEPKQKECITLAFEKEQSSSCVSLCIFITGASLTVHDIADMRCQKLLCTSSGWPCHLAISGSRVCAGREAEPARSAPTPPAPGHGLEQALPDAERMLWGMGPLSGSAPTPKHGCEVGSTEL